MGRGERGKRPRPVFDSAELAFGDFDSADLDSADLERSASSAAGSGSALLDHEIEGGLEESRVEIRPERGDEFQLTPLGPFPLAPGPQPMQTPAFAQEESQAAHYPEVCRGCKREIELVVAHAASAPQEVQG